MSRLFTHWTAEAVAALLDRDQLAVERAVVAIFHRQTADEQAAETTKHRNGRGFAACHASRGSYYARWIMAGRRLSGPHIQHARRMMKHYAGQLLEVIHERLERETSHAA